MATIYDVAKVAGVSPKTVSRVINDEPHVRDQTRQRVLKAIEKLDFRPSFSARQLTRRKSHAIALISDDISTSPYAVDVIRGAFQAAWKHKYMLLIVNTERETDIKESAVGLMIEREVEGIIYATTYHRKATPPQAIHKLPTVLLDCYVEDGSITSVVPDEKKGGYTATKTLLDKGHRRIGFVNDSEPIPASAGRLAGYKKALEEFNVSFNPELVVSTQPPEPEQGYWATKQLLQLTPRPTAIFCFNDRTAVGAYGAIREANLRIPDDVAVIGFDNQVFVSTIMDPPLTTIQLPHYEMGEWAVEKLLQIIDDHENGQEPKVVHHMIDCPLVCRDSA
ncbi:MAG: LacI family DNA-binding transcriptional regulator [Anaerolineales bacterium]|nr:LacI family DNA-binding transcriptional regulator [Anaerolineales bacterium]